MKTAFSFILSVTLIAGALFGDPVVPLPEGSRVLDTFEWKEGMLVSPTTRIEAGSAALPSGFILPEKYCANEGYSYFVSTTVIPDWDMTSEGPHRGVFTLGRNMSGTREGNSVSIVFWKGKTLFARITDGSGKESANVTFAKGFPAGVPISIGILFEKNAIQLFLNGEKIGVASIAGGFVWPKNKTFFIGGESAKESAFKGEIQQWSLSVIQKPSDPTTPEFQKLALNPYKKLIVRMSHAVIQNGAAYFINQYNTTKDKWILRSCAEQGLFAAYSWTLEGSPHFHSESALRTVTEILEALQSQSVNGRWALKNEDPNLNRFILVPFMEAFRLVEPSLEPALRERLRSFILAGIKIQVEEYGLTKKSVRDAYPNMDVYYAYLTGVGDRMFSDPVLKTQYQNIINLLKHSQYPDGGWMYIDGSNENTHYHEMLICTLAFLFHLTGDQELLAMLEKSIPYYPLMVEPNGSTEYITDPFWKHNWEEVLAKGPDAVSSITGDRKNRWIANRAPKASPEFIDYCTATVWTDGPEEAISSNHIVFDRNVQGPRGRFEEWAWVASLRTLSDTVAGAYSKDQKTGDIEGLLAVRAEVAHTLDGQKDGGSKRYALGMPPFGSVGETRIDAGKAFFSGEYPMASFRSFWGTEAYPYRWKCRQKWEMSKEKISGDIWITSEVEQKSPKPLVRFVFGRNKELVAKGNGVYEFGSYRLKLLQSDFDIAERSNVPVASTATSRLDGRELLVTIKDKGRYQANESFHLKVEVWRE